MRSLNKRQLSCNEEESFLNRGNSFSNWQSVSQPNNFYMGPHIHCIAVLLGGFLGRLSHLSAANASTKPKPFVWKKWHRSMSQIPSCFSMEVGPCQALAEILCEPIHWTTALSLSKHSFSPEWVNSFSHRNILYKFYI